MAAPFAFMVSGGGGELWAGGAEPVAGCIGVFVFCSFEHPLTVKTAVKNKKRIDLDNISLIFGLLLR